MHMLRQANPTMEWATWEVTPNITITPKQCRLNTVDMQAIKLSLQHLEMEQIWQRLDLHSDFISRFNNPHQIHQVGP